MITAWTFAGQLRLVAQSAALLSSGSQLETTGAPSPPGGNALTPLARPWSSQVTAGKSERVWRFDPDRDVKNVSVFQRECSRWSAMLFLSAHCTATAELGWTGPSLFTHGKEVSHEFQSFLEGAEKATSVETSDPILTLLDQKFRIHCLHGH